MKRVVITGATGAIGMALIYKCINNGIQVLVLCHKGSERNKYIPVNKLVKVCEYSLEELTSLDVTGLSGDVFYHLAWKGTFGRERNELYSQLNNVRYTLDAVTLAKKLGCKRFVGVGSQAEYGRPGIKLSPDTFPDPENGYGAAKLSAGIMSRLLCERLQIEHIWTRILSVYGPYDGADTMVTSTLLKMLKGEHISLTKGEQKWDYLFSEDAAEALFRLGNSKEVGKVYVLGSGTSRPLKEYVEIMKQETGYVHEVGYGEIAYSPKQVMKLEADISGLEKDILFKPEITFEEGIQKTISWTQEIVNSCR